MYLCIYGCIFLSIHCWNHKNGKRTCAFDLPRSALGLPRGQKLAQARSGGCLGALRGAAGRSGGHSDMPACLHDRTCMYTHMHACMHACMYTHMHARAWPVCASRGSIALPVTAARSSIPCRGGASAGYGAATNSACPLRREVEAGIALAFSVGVRAARGREKHCTWMRMRMPSVLSDCTWTR